MATGLLALLDDVVALVKLNAAGLNDISTQVVKTSGKVSGVVIDDAAVTPKYVVGLDPKRELAIIINIAKKSLKNKLLYLSPLALLLGFFAPFLIKPLLIFGGGYLCFEGCEKLHHMFAPPEHEHQTLLPTAELEQERIDSAVRTDFILSAEIIAIAYANVAQSPLLTQIAVLLCVAVCITFAVYGFVGLVVKADDFGLYLAQKKSALTLKIGVAIVQIMPPFLKLLSYVGTIAMLWVGSEIIIHNIAPLHHLLHNWVEMSPKYLGWIVKIASNAVIAAAVGGAIIAILPIAKKILVLKTWKK